jgi:hypothetical protein
MSTVRLVLELESDVGAERMFVMAEQWMQKLAQDLADKDREAAEDIKRREHREKLLSEQAQPFFRTFAECFKHLVEEMSTLLSAHHLHSEQNCNLDGSGRTFTFNRTRLPFISASVAYHPQGHMVNVSYTICNPEMPQNTSVAGRSIQARFEVSHHGKAGLVLDGKDFYEPKEAAEFLVKKLFTVEEPKG